MPVIEYFPYRGPNRRSDKTLVEVLLKFGPADDNGFPRSVAEIRDLLISGGILDGGQVYPAQRSADAWATGRTSSSWTALTVLKKSRIFQASLRI